MEYVLILIRPLKKKKEKKEKVILTTNRVKRTIVCLTMKQQRG